MSLLISLGLSQLNPPPGTLRTIRNFKIDPVFLKDEPKPAVKKAPKPPKPKKKTSHDIKLENLERVIEAIHAGANTQMIIAKKTGLSHATVCVYVRQLEAEERITVDHQSTPKKYFKRGRIPYRFGNKRFVMTDSIKKVLESVNNGANTQALVAADLGHHVGCYAKPLRELVENKLIRCEAKKWPREYYPIGK